MTNRHINGVKASICRDFNLTRRDFDFLLIIKYYSKYLPSKTFGIFSFVWIADKIFKQESLEKVSSRTILDCLQSLEEKKIIQRKRIDGKRYIAITHLCKTYFSDFPGQKVIDENEQESDNCMDEEDQETNPEPENKTDVKLVNGEPVKVKKDTRSRDKLESDFMGKFIDSYNSEHPKIGNYNNLKKQVKLLSIEEMAACIKSIETYLKFGYTEPRFKLDPDKYIEKKKWIEKEYWQPTKKQVSESKTELKSDMSLIDVIRIVKQDMELEYLHIGMTEQTVKSNYEFVLDGTVGKMRQAVEMAIKNNSCLTAKKGEEGKRKSFDDDIEMTEEEKQRAAEARAKIKQMMKNKGVFTEDKKQDESKIVKKDTPDPEKRVLTDEERQLEYMWQESKNNFDSCSIGDVKELGEVL